MVSEKRAELIRKTCRLLGMHEAREQKPYCPCPVYLTVI
jgi:hypothetical protein